MEKMPDKKHRYDLLEALIMRFKHDMSFQEIADHYGVPKSTIHSRLQSFIKLLDDPELNRAYSERRADFLNATERVLLSKIIDDDTVKGASLNNAAYAFDKIHSARRLEQNLSTANVASQIRVKDMPIEEQDALKRAVASMFELPKVEVKVGDDQDPGKKSEPIDV